MLTLILARHGNTFEKGDLPRRIGKKTDLPLTSFGKEQARCIGRYCKNKKISPDVVYSSPLLRAQESAKIILETLESNAPITFSEIFTEIDYGPDENKTEEEVKSRIGAEALRLWNESAIVPKGWNVDPNQIIANWQTFATEISQKYPEGTVLVTTSNGILRFSPYLTKDFIAFSQKYPIKVKTGALCIFKYFHSRWTVAEWNLTP